VRYRYIAYKYSRQGRPDTGYQSMWESFSTWPLHSAIVWRPPTDIYETPDEIIVVVEIAGMDEDSINVTLFSDLLVVEGMREQPALTDMNACHQLGIKYGHFRSEIGLHADVDHEQVKAEYRNGLLTITLRKIN
jgi:HSP20 family protein